MRLSVLKGHTLKRNTKQTITAYLMIGLPIIGFFAFTLYPLLWAMMKSFYYYTGKLSDMQLVGFQNFIDVFKDATYWSRWAFTFKLAICKLCLEIPLAFVAALLLTRNIKLKGFFRSVYFLPTIVSVSIAGILYSVLFDYYGIINEVLIKLGLIDKQIDWFGSSSASLLGLVISTTWKTFGLNVIYFIAAISNVPEDCYEAAKIDGAGPLRTTFSITLPLIAPVFQTILLLAINGTLHESEFILVATNGAPGGSTFTVMSYVVSSFVPGFASTVVNIGYGCAISLVTSIIFSLIAIIYMKATKKMSNI